MGLWGKAAKALVIVVIIQIACRHCMPRTPRKSALLNNLNPAKNNPLSTPFPPTRSDKTSKQTFGKTNQNAGISKNPFANESIFKKKHNFPENDFPLDTTPRDPFQLKTNFNNYQANRAKANSLRNTQSSIINEMKKERKMKRKLQSNAQLNNDINQPTKEMNPTTFTSGSVNTLLDPQAFPDIQYPLNTMETWEPMYWNSFSLAPPTPFDGLETPRSKSTINENIKIPSARMTKTKARQFLKSYDKRNEENKRTSTDNSKRSNAGQSGLNFKKTATSEKASEDFITASLLERDPKKSSVTNITVLSSSGETPNSDTQDICPISDTPVNTGITKSNRSESATKTDTSKYSKISLLTEALAAIEDILNSDETNTSVSAENICAIPEVHINTTCYPIMNETTTGRIDHIEVNENTGNNLQSSTNSSDETTACEELLEAEIDDIPLNVLQSNISSLLEETNVENFTIVESMLNVETQAPTVGTPIEVAFADKLNQTLANQAAPGPTSIIIIPINNNAVGPPQSHMIDTTGNAPIIVYIPSTQSNDVPAQTMFGQQNISQVSSNKTVPSNELNNDLSNTAPLLNDNPASTALVSELLDDISNSESSLPMCEPLPINSMCYNNESSQSSIKEKPFLNNATHTSINDMTPFVNCTSNEKSFDDESIDIRDDNINAEKTLPQMLDSEHPIFDFPGSEVTCLSDGPYNNIDNELPILPREIDSNQVFVNSPSEQELVPKDNATLDDHQLYTEDIVPESNLLSHDMPKIYDIDSQTVVTTEPINISLLPVDESIQSIPLSENLGALRNPADKTIPTPTSEAHTTSIPIELSLSPSQTKNMFDKRIIIDVKLVPIEDTSDDHHSMKTVQDSLPLPPDVLSSQSNTDKLSERQDHIDSIFDYEPSRTRNNFQEQRYEMLHSTPYLEANYNLASSYEVDESKTYLVNNLVAPIPNTDPSHGNIELTTKDIKDLPLRMGILLPDFSELMEDEPISYNMPKIEHSEESTNADMSNVLPIKMLDHLPLNQFDTTLLSEEDMKADDVSNNTSEVLNRPAVLPEDVLIFEAIKPFEYDFKIDEVTNKSVTPDADSVPAKDEIESIYRNLNDNKSLLPPRAENSLTEAEPSLADHSPIAFNSDLLVNLPLPTDMSSLTSKLLVTKALLDNVLADINNTYNTGVLSPSTESIPIFIPLAETNRAVENPPSGPPLNRNQFNECKENSLLPSEEVFPNIEKDSKKDSLNMLPITNLDECNSTDLTANNVENLTLPENMCPLIPTSEFPPSREQVNIETIQIEPTHDIKKSVDEIDNASFPKSDLSSDTAVPHRLINGPSNHTGDSIDIPHADGNLYSSQELVHINDSFSEHFKDIIPILDAPRDQTIIKEDEADKLNLESQHNDPKSKSDDIPPITVTKDLLESVLLDIFTKRLSLPLTQTNADTLSVSKGTTHHLESTDTSEEENSIKTSLLGQLDDTIPTPSVLEKPVLATPNSDTTSDSLLMQVDKGSSTVLDDKDTEILNSLKEEISNKGINSLVIPADQTPSQIFDEKEERDYSTLKDHTDESSLSKKKTMLTTSSSDSPDYDNEHLKQISSSSSEITITKELLESVLTDVLRKELLLPRAQSFADFSPLLLTTPPNDKETSITNTTTIDNSLKENNEATFKASLVDKPADLTDTSFNMSPNQSSIQLDDNIQHQENNLPLVDYIDDEQSKPEKESIHATNNEAIQLPTTIKIPLQNALKDISSEGFTLSVVESAASPSIIEPDIPDNIISGTRLEDVGNNSLNTQTVDSLDSPIDHEIIETHEHESTENQSNDETLPIDEIIISVPNNDIFAPKSPSELRITKALLENVLMDIFTKGLSGLVEKRLHVPSDDDITNKSPTQVLEASSNTAHTDHSRDNLIFLKETEINLPTALSDTTSNETSSKLPTDNSNISTFDKEEENNNDMPLDNGNDERSSIEDTKLDSNKNIHEDNMPSTEKEKYSTSKLTITKALLENLLTDILTKGLSLPEQKPSPITSPTALDKTLYYTETDTPNISNESPLIEEDEIPLDISLVGQINNDSIHTENSEDTIPTPGDKAILDTPSIDSYTDQNMEVIDKDQNHNNNLALKEYKDDLSPLNEGISEPRTVPVASRSVLDKTLYFVDTIPHNIREQTVSKPTDETIKIMAENFNVSGEENDSILEQDSEEITQDKPDLDAISKESFEEEVLENNSEDLSKDAEELTSLENTSDDLSLKEDIHDVIEEIVSSPALTPKRVLYSKLPSTKALLEKILFDITDGAILG